MAVGVEQGDLLAYYLPSGQLISFDRGTGQSLYRRADVTIGEQLKSNMLQGEAELRAYSIGVYGLLGSANTADLNAKKGI